MINKKKAAIFVGVLVVLAVAAMIVIFQGQAAGQVIIKAKSTGPKLDLSLAARQQAPSQEPAEPRPQPAIVGQPFADFTLPVYQGGTMTLSSLRGKNVLLLFPRGWAAENYWCTICNYRYVELAELEKAQKIQEKYNVVILVVFPYPRDVVTAWLEALPGQLENIRTTKNPADPSKLDERGKARM